MQKYVYVIKLSYKLNKTLYLRFIKNNSFHCDTLGSNQSSCCGRSSTHTHKEINMILLVYHPTWCGQRPFLLDSHPKSTQMAHAFLLLFLFRFYCSYIINLFCLYFLSYFSLLFPPFYFSHRRPF
jgi:hypothetical protein